MSGLAVLFGAVVGFSLGLTGGGGGIFAVPLLVYGLSLAPREAVGVSLASVGVIALLGSIAQVRRGHIAWGTGLWFAIAGMMGAPLGTSLSRLLPDAVLLMAFSGLMLFVALKMWQYANRAAGDGEACQNAALYDQETVVQTNSPGPLWPRARRFLGLGFAGLASGMLSGMFGVGGGFVIVPTLVLFTDMSIHRAVGTSLLVIFLVSISAVRAYLASGGALSLPVTSLFVVGGLVGLRAGNLLGTRLPGPHLQRTFSLAMVLVAVFIVGQSLRGIEL